MKWTSLFAYFIIVEVVSSALIQYDTSVDCSVGCSLTDPTIWVGNILPTANDTVAIIVPIGERSGVFSISELNITYMNVIAQDIELHIYSSLQVTNNVSLVDSDVIVYANATFHVILYAYFMGISNISVQQYGSLECPGLSSHSSIYFDTPSNLEIEGQVYLLIYNIYIYGSVATTTNGVLYLYGLVTYAPRFASINSFAVLGYATIPDNKNIILQQGATFSNLTIGVNTNVTIMNRASIANPNLRGTGLKIKNGGSLNLINIYGNYYYESMPLPSGQGVINVHSSQLTFYGDRLSNLPSVPLYFSGTNNSISFFQSVVQNIGFSADADIHILVDNLTMINNQPSQLYIPGDVVVSLGTLQLQGLFKFAGGIGAYGSYINSCGANVEFGEGVVIAGDLEPDSTPIYSIWNSSSLLTAPKVTVYNSSIFYVCGNLQINGDVEISHGNLVISEQYYLTIEGGYIQGETSNFTVRGIDTSHPSVRLNVSQTATIAGQVLYTYTNLAPNVIYPILHSSPGGISGHFNPTANALYGNIEIIGFVYDEVSTVSLLYSEASSQNTLWILHVNVLVILLCLFYL